MAFSSTTWVSLFQDVYLLVMVSMFSIGLMVGGIARDTKVAGVIASILYFPMLIFSGATLPYEVMPSAMQKAADILPLTQGIKLLMLHRLVCLRKTLTANSHHDSVGNSLYYRVNQVLPVGIISHL